MRLRDADMGALARIASVVALAALNACASPPPPGYNGGYPVATAPGSERAVELEVGFDFNSYRIRVSDYPGLDSLVGALLDPRLAGYRFDINGHTDVTGRLGYNIVLSRLRAEAVASYLAQRGLPRGLMNVQGFGPLQLLDTYNPTSPVNRRVEVVALR